MLTPLAEESRWQWIGMGEQLSPVLIMVVCSKPSKSGSGGSAGSGAASKSSSVFEAASSSAFEAAVLATSSGRKPPSTISNPCLSTPPDAPTLT